MASAWSIDASLPTQSNTTSAPSVSRPASTIEPACRRTARASWSGGTTWSAPSVGGQLALAGVLGPDDHGARGQRADQAVDGGQRGQPERARRRPRPRGRRRRCRRTARRGRRTPSARSSRRPRRRQSSGTAWSWLAWAMSGRSTIRRRCRCRIRSAARAPDAPAATLPHSPVCPDRTGRRAGGCGGGRSRAPARARHGCRGRATAGLVDTAIVEHADHFVARHEGKRHQVLEVAGGAPVDVARSDPQMPDSSGRSGCQSSSGRSGGSVSSSRSGPIPAPRPEPKRAAPPGSRRTGARCAPRPAPSPSSPARRAAGRPARAAGLERPRRAAPRGRAGRAAAAGWLPPLGRASVSTCQPRRRAMAASLASGLTATGKPTASSMGRSLAESA